MKTLHEKAETMARASKLCSLIQPVFTVSMGMHRVIDPELPTYLGVTNMSVGSTMAVSPQKGNKLKKTRIGIITAGTAIQANTVFQGLRDLAMTDANILNIAERVGSPAGWVALSGTIVKNMLEAGSFASQKVINALDKISTAARSIGTVFTGLAGVNHFTMLQENGISEAGRGVMFFSQTIPYLLTLVPPDQVPKVREYLSKGIISASVLAAIILFNEAAQGNVAWLEAIGRLAFGLHGAAQSTNQLRVSYEEQAKREANNDKADKH
jgi:hypothetical protein